MSHRGPDDAGVLDLGEADFGFRRLAIIDVSAAGRQPMTSRDGRVTLVYNGEIYNFQELRRELESGYAFQSATDSEVLIHGFVEWGWAGLLDRIDGMFAFAIWDQRARTLYAARDRVGKKPFYFRRSAEGVVFASTLNALLALLPDKPPISRPALDAYLTYQAVPAPYTMFEGVEQLPPAHALVHRVATGETTVSRYWDVSFVPKRRRPEAEVIQDLDDLIREAVRKRLVSDVPLGAFLSGGVDSSLVVSMMARESGSPVEAVVIGFDDPRFDERPLARAVARRWGVRLHEEVLQSNAASHLPGIVWHFGQPVADVSIVPTYFVARAAKRYVTVALNGDGGDELFGGYARPVIARAAERYRRLPASARRRLAGALSRHEQGRLRRAALLARDGRVTAAEAFVYDRAFRCFRDEAYGPALKGIAQQWDPDALYREVWERAVGADDVDRVLYGDFATYLPDQLLVKMDVATMAHSVEARSPLLDRALVEYAAGIPTAQRLRGFTTKYLLKRLAERYVPREVIYRRKQGFVAPMAPWLRGALAAAARGALDSEAFLDRGWIRADFVRRMLAEHASGIRNWGEQLWTLLVLEIWARQSIDGTLAWDAPLEALTSRPSSRPRAGNGHRTTPISTLQIGMQWFGESPGGLNRVYEQLARHLPDTGVEVRGLVAGSPDVAATSGGRVTAFAPTRSPLPARWRGVRRHARAMLAQAPADVIVSHFALYTYPVLDVVDGCPLVVHFQGPWAQETAVEGASRATVWARHAVERAVYGRATRCIVLTQSFGDILSANYGVPGERIHVIPGGIDARRFDSGLSRAEARERLRWPADRPIVLAVRRLVRRMGLENLVRATADVRRRFPDVLVLIAGKGTIAGELQAQIDAAGLRANVRLLGFVADEELPLAYRAADLSVAPTVALEGFGLVVAESLAAGTPALVTPVTGLPEVVLGLARELVLPAADPVGLAEGLVAALDGTLRLPDPEACARFARERYDWPVIAARVGDVYREALG